MQISVDPLRIHQIYEYLVWVYAATFVNFPMTPNRPRINHPRKMNPLRVSITIGSPPIHVLSTPYREIEIKMLCDRFIASNTSRRISLLIVHG